MRLLRFAVLGILAGAMVLAAKPASAALAADVPARAPSFNAPVYAVAISGDTVYVGGAFTSATAEGRTVGRDRLAAFDVRTGALLDWRPAADDVVRALTVHGTTVYVAGDFNRINGNRRDSLAAVDGRSGSVGPLSHAVTGQPRTIGAGNGRLYLGGRITEVSGVTRGNVAAFRLDTGALDTGWAGRTDDIVESLAVADDRVYLGGVFRAANGDPGAAKLVALDADTGRIDRGFAARPGAVVHTVAVGPSGVHAAVGGQGGRLMSFRPDGSSRWMATFDGDVQAVTEVGGMIYVGGHFDFACTTNANGTHGRCTDGEIRRVKHAAFTADGRITSWAPNGNGIAGSLALASSRSQRAVVSVGEFTEINGVDQRRVALFHL